MKEFLKHYEIRPKKQEEQQSTNEKENASMAKKKQQEQPQPQQQPEQHTQVEQAAQGMEGQPAGEQQAPVYRYNENMIDWEALGKVGVSKEMLEQSGALDSMLKGYKTNKTIPLTLNIDGVMTAKLDARLSFISTDGQVILGVHGIRKEPELSRPYFGHNFTEEEKKNLRESGNLGASRGPQPQGWHLREVPRVHRPQHQRTGGGAAGECAHPEQHQGRDTCP